MSYSAQPPLGPPQQPPPKQGMSTGGKVGIGCGGCLGVLLLLFMFAGCVSVVSSDTSSTRDTETEAADEVEPDEAGEEDADNGETGGEDDEDGGHALGDTFEHGSFEFTVHSVDFGVQSVEGEFTTQEPRGEYVVVELTAENISSSAEYLNGSDQVLMDADGSMYEYDITASTDASFIDQLNPGQSAEATLVYDIEPDTEIDHMLVNGETFMDDGVRVDLD